MKRILLALLIVTGSIAIVQAQKTAAPFSLNGVIQDSVSGRPLSYATVSLFDTAGNLIASTWSPESGTFNIPLPASGLYHLEISSVGYRTKRVPVNINKKQIILLENIMLNSQAPLPTELLS